MRYVSTSERVMCAALAAEVVCGRESPANGPEVRVYGVEKGCGGRESSMRRVMAERWTPASTATREPLRQFWATDRTRKAVVFDS